MIEQFINAQTLGCEKYPRNSKSIIQYGTAGFRDKSTELPHVMFRMGLLSVLRSKVMKGSTVGLMITASHNPEEDNGVKLCDPDGKMLEKEWEIIAMQLINSNNDGLVKALTGIVILDKIDYSQSAHVFVARDTRKSSVSLERAALDGIECLKGNHKDFGLLTTPQLHFAVYCSNFPSYGTASEEGYYEKFSKVFEEFRSNAGCKKKYQGKVYVDGANGIGALKFKALLSYIPSLNAEIFNDGSKGILNYKCGADFVKVEQGPPIGCELQSGCNYASFDGDADRLIYFYKDFENDFHLLDGDKISTLISKFIKELVDLIPLKLEMRVIQTAYANGGSTQYIQNVLRIPAICVPTGVKHLHHEAAKYDIGVYFEANGHGTVVFSNEAKQKIRNLAGDKSVSEVQRKAAYKLSLVIDLINETVGDAITDLLLVEAILHDLDWSIMDWDQLYTDFPNRQLKVKVPDRNAIETADAERKCVKPIGLQDEIDAIVKHFQSARSFVRPSGTEDVVRVYAEANTQDQTDKLASEVKSLVEKYTQSS